MKNQSIELIPPALRLAEPLCAYYLRNREFLQPFEPVREDAFFTPEYQREVLRGEMLARENGTGCRFYIRLSDDPEKIIGSIMGPEVTLVSAGEESARELQQLLNIRDLQTGSTLPGRAEYCVSDRVEDFERIASLFLQEDLHHEARRIDIEQY